MAASDKGRLVYGDGLRVAATAAVVILHLSGGWIEQTAVDGWAWMACNIYDGFVRWCVPVFVMLSGMFLLDPTRRFAPSDLLRHALRVVIPLAVWSAVYGVFALLLSHTLSLQTVVDALKNALWGHLHYHLWFLPMILGLYLVTPILRAFVKGASRSDFHYFFLLTFLVTFLLPTLLNLRPSQTVSTWLNQLNLSLVLGYVGYYVAGYYLRVFSLSRPVRLTLYVLGAAGGVVTVWGTALLSRQSGVSDFTLYSYMAPNVLVMAVALFVLFRTLVGERVSAGGGRMLSGTSAITFGIYLSHDLFIMLLRHYGISTLSPLPPAVSIPLLAAGVFLCAAAVAWLLSKLPVVGRYLI